MVTPGCLLEVPSCAFPVASIHLKPKSSPQTSAPAHGHMQHPAVPDGLRRRNLRGQTCNLGQSTSRSRSRWRNVHPAFVRLRCKGHLDCSPSSFHQVLQSGLGQAPIALKRDETIRSCGSASYPNRNGRVPATCLPLAVGMRCLL